MEFRVLGRLEVIGTAGPIELHGSKRRAMLGLLLVERGRVVSSDRVVRHVWHDDPTALSRVKSTVHELRKLLGADGHRLITAAGGYSLPIEPDELDAWAFEEAVAQAASMADKRRAVSLLSDALDRWRGRALDDFAEAEWAIGEATRLERLRLQGCEALVDAELDIGDHARAVGRLESWVVDHPLREHFWSQLMLALYRCGRQAEALDAYQRVHALLVDQLGIRPSKALAELERSVLQHDPALDWSPSGSGGVAAMHLDAVVRPAGTVTFLFTDIEDSTRLSEEHPELMRAALSRRDEILTAVLKRSGGCIFALGGDGLAVAFQRAGNAIDAAIDAQRQLSAEPSPEAVALRVRMALHTGEATERDGNYFGPPVNRTGATARRCRRRPDGSRRERRSTWSANTPVSSSWTSVTTTSAVCRSRSASISSRRRA